MIGTKRTILLVEDNPNDIELTLRAFEKHKLANVIDVARDGVEAMEYLESRKHNAELTLPAVILLDLKLPRIDGLEVLRRIRADERLRRIPIVILTSSNEDRDRMRGYELGANSYVRKPVDFGEFMHAARDLGMYWLVLNEPAE
ncbi:MAG TPA: response regulator [Candidatus Limnocylindrales bacterium]|nr:response regulator [Candidatus Limnocylindrales bacterium]